MIDNDSDNSDSDSDSDSEQENIELSIFKPQSNPTKKKKTKIEDWVSINK